MTFVNRSYTNRVPFCEKWHIKGTGLDLPAGPLHIKLCRVPPRRNTRSHVVCNQYATQNSSNETVTKQPQISHRERTLFYSRRFKKPEERICPICKIEMEDEYHFLNICPAYQEKRCSLLDYLIREYRIKVSRMSSNKIFVFNKRPLRNSLSISRFWGKRGKMEAKKGRELKERNS